MSDLVLWSENGVASDTQRRQYRSFAQLRSCGWKSPGGLQDDSWAGTIEKSIHQDSPHETEKINIHVHVGTTKPMLGLDIFPAPCLVASKLGLHQINLKLGCLLSQFVNHSWHIHVSNCKWTCILDCMIVPKVTACGTKQQPGMRNCWLKMGRFVLFFLIPEFSSKFCLSFAPDMREISAHRSDILQASIKTTKQQQHYNRSLVLPADIAGTTSLKLLVLSFANQQDWWWVPEAVLNNCYALVPLWSKR